ncbi:conserved Plasmodium protein, unknown function [Plasmodium malariae]|uniref:Tyrosine-protein kinase ephrin type A/B receptor-like domain-containing protein n=1 Tax=Plasmodium malariae TaxID=5858 RepID=A0A1D3JLZ6_PLAMA|nr:conserved Plasmodium protein, unknown function [Plasmodium malariae]SBT87697.1 conserved Plasmodium protein, unknown function [Plasmodium malariae]
MNNFSINRTNFFILIILLLIRKNKNLDGSFSGLNVKRKIRFLNVMCRAGEMLTYDFKCEQCKKGFYNFSRVNNVCLPCPLGTFSDKLGSVVCRNCPNGSTTNAVGSQSELECICNKGYKLNTLSRKCIKCNVLEFCDDNENIWSFKNMCMKEKNEEYVELCNEMKHEEIYNYQILCFKKGVCLNFKEKRSCSEGNKLIQCKICEENYRYDFISPQNSPCILCHLPTYLVTLYFFLLIFFINILTVLCLNNTRQMILIKMFIKYTHYISLLRYVNSNYDHYIANVFYFFTIGIPLNEILDCIITKGTNSERIIKKVNFLLFLPPLYVVFSLLCTFSLYLYIKKIKVRLNNSTTSSKGKKLISENEIASGLIKNENLSNTFHKSHLSYSRTKNKNARDFIDIHDIIITEGFGKCFFRFFILYHDFLYFETIRLCIFFYLCNYDEHRRASFIIIDDSLKCSELRSKNYLKIWIIVIYNTFIKFSKYFILLLKKSMKKRKNSTILDKALLIHSSVTYALHGADDFFLLLFLVLFHKRFLNNVNSSLIYNCKNGIYNTNIHTAQYIITTVSFLLYIVIIYLYIYDWGPTQELEQNYEHGYILHKTSRFTYYEKKRKYDESGRNVHNKGDNRSESYHIQSGNIKNGNTQNDNRYDGGKKRPLSEEVRTFEMILHEENNEKVEVDVKEESREGSSDSNDSIFDKSKQLDNNSRNGSSGRKTRHCNTNIFSKCKVANVVTELIKKKKIDKFVYYFSMFIHITVLLSYYTISSYVHLSGFHGIITLISIICNCIIYVTFFLLLLKCVKEDIKNVARKNISRIKKLLEKMTCIKKSISRNPKIAILENKSCKNLNDLKLRNDEIEEQFVLKNEKRSIKLINNILKSSRNYMNRFSKTVNKSTVDIDKETPPKKNNNKKKKYVKRYKLFNISKTWIFFLYNVIDLSDEPEKCLAMFISLTLEKRFPNLNLEECLKVLNQNHFDEIKNISFILKNFLKCKDKFLNILKKKKKMQHMDYESLIIFAWGMSILSYCNLGDINYNLSTILFHISNVLNKCRYFKNAMDHYLASFNFPHSDLYNMTRNINHRRALTLSDRSFSDNYYYDYSERTKKNFNFVDCGTQDFTICRERLCGNNDEDKNSNVKDEQLRVHRMNNTDFPISSLENSSYDDWCTAMKKENLMNDLEGLLLNGELNLMIMQLLNSRKKGGVKGIGNTKKDGFFFDVSHIYSAELCRIFLHCLLVDVSELYFNIHYKYTCEKYICTNIVNLWGYNISNNFYMKRYFEYLEKYNKSYSDIFANDKILDRVTQYENKDTGITFNIPDYINRNVLDIDFYHAFERLNSKSKNYLTNLTQEEGDCLNVKDLTDFAQVDTNVKEIEEKRRKREKEKKKEEFLKFFCNASPVFIEKCCLGCLDIDELKLMEQKKRDFITLYENMGGEYIDHYIIKNYEQKINYFQMDNYGSVISISGTSLRKLQNMESKIKKKGDIEIDERSNINYKSEENDLLSINYMQFLNKNMYNYMNYEHVKGGKFVIFTHNSYRCNAGITGDLKGINFYDKNSLVIINPSIILPKECTVELWLYLDAKIDNVKYKNFVFSDKSGNSLFVIDRKNEKIENIEVHITQMERLSRNYRNDYDIEKKMGIRRGRCEKNCINYVNCSNCGGIYIESEKTKKWGKLNKIIKKNKWNLLNLTKCPNGLIYYINGKYLSRISYEVLDLEKNFEVSIFGNSCFGNNNIGLCSSFKIYEFLNKEEIKRRYKLIKNIKCKEMIGDNINMEIDNTIIEGIDIRNEFMIENIFFMYFAQSQKNNTRVIPLANDSKYKFKVYQLKFFTKYSMAENNLYGRNILFCEAGKKDECKFGEVTTPVLHLKKGNKIKNANNSNEKKGEKKKDKNNHSKINLIYDRDEYGYDIYFKKISRKGDLPKIYGINVFSDNLSFACDMSSFYNLVLYPSLSIYNELIKPCGYTISAWVFFPIEKNISFSSLISGENDTHVCIFNDDLILGCIENYNKEKKGYINYHSSGYSIKKLNKGWYYLSVVGTLKGQFYFINGGFKGYHKFCSFDNIKYIGNSSLFINPFPYICFIQVSNKPLSMNDILYEYTISPSCYNFTYSYYYFYLSSFFANLITNELKNDSITLVSDSSISANHLNNADYVHFDITENYDVHIYPYHESKRYYFSVSLNSMKNRRLYFFNSIKDQVNNLSIYLNNYVLLPENWTIFTVINLSYVNESSYHCLLGGQNGSSHIVIDGSDLSLGVLTNLEHLSNFSNSGCGFLCQQGSYNKFKNKKKFRGEKNENIINISLKENSTPKELSLERSFSNNKKNYNRNGNNKINPYMLKHKKYYGKFHSSGYNFQNMLNKNILLTSRCAKNEQTFFINTSKVGVCHSCSSPITCIGNCSSINNEYLSPFGFYKFVRIVFEYVTDEQIREYYNALNL